MGVSEALTYCCSARVAGKTHLQAAWDIALFEQYPVSNFYSASGPGSATSRGKQALN